MGGFVSVEKRRESNRRWREQVRKDPVLAERERLKRQERFAKWYEAQKTDAEYQAKRAEQKRADYLRNKEKRNAKKQEWAAEHRPQVRAIWKKFYDANLEAQRALSRQKYINDPESKKATCRLWAVANPDKVNAKEAKRRALKLGSTVGAVDYKAVVASANGLCGICREPIDDGAAVHIDHIVPLAKGGSHTQDNLQLSHAVCNLRKGDSLSERVG